MTFGEHDLPPLLVELIRSAEDGAEAGPATTQGDLMSGRAEPLGKAREFFGAVNVGEAVELYAAVRALNPTASAEIGFCCAGSGMAILKALADAGTGTHYACDPYQSSYAKNAGLRNVEDAGLSARLRFHEAFPEACVPGFPRLQFAFIDASHLFDLSLLDFSLVDKRLDVGGVVAFHDLWMGSLQKLVRFILNNRGYRLYTPPGVAVAVPQKVPRVRSLVASAFASFAGSDQNFYRRDPGAVDGVWNWQRRDAPKSQRGRPRLAPLRSFLIAG